ncbi:hypothetical protein B0A68_03910 [Flavobacterium reichenbachii]|uniref:Uncharacterized protein n=2 Tax=Flavobacterium reichenbachii TaxID=362418 RepID=A0A085ZPG9_9FLAO|nr:hypothetical protein IW19_12735 [Flavobacterium reichenbachii]OXB17451.1 hypothetical protein B0A68_03910 [Flavobacterium reichenbachii]
MKMKKETKKVQKFGLEKFEVAKLKKLHLIVGGGIAADPLTGHTDHNKANSSARCQAEND